VRTPPVCGRGRFIDERPGYVLLGRRLAETPKRRLRGPASGSRHQRPADPGRYPCPDRLPPGLRLTPWRSRPHDQHRALHHRPEALVPSAHASRPRARRVAGRRLRSGSHRRWGRCSSAGAAHALPAGTSGRAPVPSEDGDGGLFTLRCAPCVPEPRAGAVRSAGRRSLATRASAPHARETPSARGTH
jgi:hypothetical protein